MTVSIKQHFKHAPVQEEIEFKRIMDAVLADLTLLRAEVVLIGTSLASVKAIYDAHTHECPGSSYTASRCSLPDTGAAENSLTPSSASAITDSSTAIAALNLAS